MCKDCRTPDAVTYRGRDKVLTKTLCPCKDCSTITFSSEGRRCINCDCLIPIQLTDDPDYWEDHPIWVDPRTKHPVRLDEVKT